MSPLKEELDYVTNDTFMQCISFFQGGAVGMIRGKEYNTNIRKQCNLFSTIVNVGEKMCNKIQYLEPQNNIQISNKTKEMREHNLPVKRLVYQR